MSKNIEINYKTSDSYELLYPVTIADNVSFSSTTFEGTLSEYALSIASQFQEVDEAKANMEFGYYMGTGTSGANNPNSLSFTKYHNLVIVKNDGGNIAYGGYTMIVLRYVTKISPDLAKYNYTFDSTIVTWEDYKITWYSTHRQQPVQAQMNANVPGSAYCWIAI